MDTAFTWIAAGLAILLLGTQAVGWLWTAFFFGGLRWPMIRTMARLTLLTRRLRFTLLHLMGVLGVVAFYANGQLPLGCLILAVAAGAYQWTRSLLPPVALLLAGSNPQTGQLLREVRRKLYPLRVVVLLDPSRIGQSRTQRWGDQDNLRTSDGAVWKSVVHHLIAMARVVVLDTREASDPVRYEAMLMLDPGRIRKAAVLGADDGTCPSLARHGIDTRASAIPVYTAKELPGVLGKLIGERSRLQNPEDSVDLGEGVLREKWGTLPRVLAIGIGDTFDSKDILDETARADSRDLIEIHLPDAYLDMAAAREHVDLSFDFLRDRRLVAVYHHRQGILALRRQFLLDVAGQLPRVRAVSPVGRLSFDDLMKPDPLRVALAEFCDSLRSLASRRGLKFRDLATA